MHLGEVRVQSTAASSPAGGRITGLTLVAPGRLLGGQRALIAVVAGLTWLGLVGGLLSDYILSDGAAPHTHSVAAYAAYDVRQAAPTSFGSLTVSRANLAPTGDAVVIDVSVRIDSTQDAQTDAPRLEQLRLIDTNGTDVTTTPGRWNGPAVLVGHSSATIDLEYLARPTDGPLWLEYADPYGPWPIRIHLGDAPQGAHS
jgi:hypothetical protein